MRQTVLRGHCEPFSELVLEGGAIIANKCMFYQRALAQRHLRHAQVPLTA